MQIRPRGIAELVCFLISIFVHSCNTQCRSMIFLTKSSVLTSACRDRRTTSAMETKTFRVSRGNRRKEQPSFSPVIRQKVLRTSRSVAAIEGLGFGKSLDRTGHLMSLDLLKMPSAVHFFQLSDAGRSPDAQRDPRRQSAHPGERGAHRLTLIPVAPATSSKALAVVIRREPPEIVSC